MSTRPPAMLFGNESRRSRYRAGKAGLMRTSWAPATPALFPKSSVQSRELPVGFALSLNSSLSTLNSSVTRGRFELPCLNRHDVLSVACLPFHHLAVIQNSSKCVEQESNLHSVKRVGYNHLGSPMPSRRVIGVRCE